MVNAMRNNRLLGTGIVGSVVSMLCCFTPLLVFVLGGVGLSAWLGWLDWILFPAMVFFTGITVFALARRRRLRESSWNSQTPSDSRP